MRDGANARVVAAAIAVKGCKAEFKRRLELKGAFGLARVTTLGFVATVSMALPKRALGLSAVRVGGLPEK
jgi:hypothetical protein